VRSVYVDGRPVVADGALLTVAASDVLARSTAAATALAARAGTDRFADRPWRSLVSS
jgi:5-methylthioadenosine/S-adenosylhomocysteine deaminase